MVPMDRSIYWATVAQVAPVLFVVLAVELGMSRVSWGRALIPIRIVVSVIIVALVYIEVARSASSVVRLSSSMIRTSLRG
jgi:uncharacterized membrane protein